MRKSLFLLFLLWASPAWASIPTPVTIPYFGSSWFYKPDEGPSIGFVAVLSPSTGWDEQTAHTARHLAHEGYAVLGLDAKVFEASTKGSDAECVYPSGLIEEAAQDLQKTPDHPMYHRPLIVGLGDSGILAATTMLQALPGTYKGALAPQFCAASAVSKLLCLGSRMVRQDKAYRLAKSGVVKADEGLFLAAQEGCGVDSSTWPVQASDDARSFIDDGLKKLQAKKQAEAIDALKDLPLEYLPAEDNDWLVILISGDGGWRDIDRQIGEKMQKAGYAVIGIDSLRYFWNEKTPAETAAMLDRVVAEAQQAWNKRRVALIGYSFGADLLPFAITQMKTASHVSFMGLLGFTRYALFEITAGSFVGIGDTRYDNKEQIKKIPPSIKTLCVYGQSENADDDDSESLCPALHQPQVETLGLSGGHHFDGDYQGLTQQLIDRIKQRP
ncbi:MAG: alpha/beta fold hydrolase [Bdellovibrionales bacterium]|jgi:type IV secretory pathway VirJ component